MRMLGYVLIAAGFLAGSFVAVQTAENQIAWGWMAPALIVGAVGVVLARLSLRGAATQEARVTSDIESLRASLERIVERIRRLDADKAELDPYDVHGRIDALFPADLTTFVDARESIGHQFGLQAYADVMNEFAAGERYLNRAWSASVDGWIDEVQEYLGRAREQFERTREKLQALSASPS